MRFMVIIVGLAVLVMLSTPAHATKMSGKISVKKAFVEALEQAEREQSKGTKSYYWKLPNGIIPVQPPRLDLTGDIAVVLYKDDPSDAKPDDVRPVAVQTGELAQTVIVTHPGSTLKFTNESPYVHELYSPEHPDFKPEAQSKGAFRPIEFKSEGVYTVRCKRMPHFLGYVVVTPGRQLTIKPDGSFADEIEPGNYTLKVFHQGKWIHKQSFTAEGNRMDPLTVTLSAGSSDKETAKAESEPKKKKDKK